MSDVPAAVVAAPPAVPQPAVSTPAVTNNQAPPAAPPATTPEQQWQPITPDYPIQFDHNGQKISKPVGDLVRRYTELEGVDPAEYRLYENAFKKNDAAAIAELAKRLAPAAPAPAAPLPTPADQQIAALNKRLEQVQEQLQRMAPVTDNITYQSEVAQIKGILAKPEIAQKFPLLAKAPNGAEMVKSRFDVLRQGLGDRAKDPMALRSALETSLTELQGFIGSLAPVFQTNAAPTSLSGLLDDQGVPGTPEELPARYVLGPDGVLYDRMSPAYKATQVGLGSGPVPTTPVTPPAGAGVGMGAPRQGGPMTTEDLVARMRARRSVLG